jgi:hypothetical protein
MSPPSPPDLDIVSHVLPPLGAIHVTDVIQRLFPELNATQGIELIRKFFPELNVMLDIELMWRLFSELKAIQVVELMSLGRWFPDVVQTGLQCWPIQTKIWCHLLVHDFSRPQ